MSTKEDIEELKMLLRGIQRLKSELQFADFSSNFHTEYEKFIRLQNLLWCLNDVCWKVHGDRKEDKQG
jgi:hypothetical protein